MSVPTTFDRDLLRLGQHALAPVLNAVPFTPIATAEVNQPAFKYPIGQLTVASTDGWDAIKVGYAFCIGTAPGLGDVTWGVVRKAPTADTFYCDAKSLGDPGYARAIHQQLLPGHYLTVLKYRPPWGLLSSIRKGVFYKDFDRPYAGEGSNPAPVVVMGPWQQVFADPTDGYASLELNAAGSFAWGSKTIAGYQWALDGGTVHTGSLTDAEIYARFTPGFYELECTVTDSKGRQHTGYRYLWVNSTDPANEWAPLNWKYRLLGIANDRQDRLGRSLTLQFEGPFAPDTFFPGQAFHLHEHPTYDGFAPSKHAVVFQWAGYASDRAVDVTRTRRTITINCKSPLALAKSIPAASQRLVEQRAPKDWTECTADLSHPPGAIWYIMQYHAPYLVDGHDFLFEPALLNLRRKSFIFQSLDIGGQIAQVAELMIGNIGNRSDGSLRMVRNPNYFNNAARNALPVRWTWTPADLVSRLTRPFSYRMNAASVMGYAFAYNGGSESIPYAALAPGDAPAQGVARQQMTPFIVPESEGINRVREIVGFQFAAENTPTPNVTFEANRNLDVAEPCDLDEWHVLDLPADYDPEETGWIGEYLLPVRVNRTWAGTTPKKRLTVEMSPATFGYPGIPKPVNRGAANTDDGWVVPDPYEPKMPDIGTSIKVMLAWNRDGVLGQSFSFSQPVCTWKPFVMPGAFAAFKVRDGCLDPRSSWYTNPDTGSLGAFFLADDGTNLKLIVAQDIARTDGTLIASAAPDSWSLSSHPGYSGRARVHASIKDGDLGLAVAWRDSTGVWLARNASSVSTDLTARFRVGPAISNDPYVDRPVALWTWGKQIAVVAPTGATDPVDGKPVYGLYFRDDYGAALQLVANLPAGERLLPDCVLIRTTDVALAGSEKLEPPPPAEPLSIIDFEIGSYSNYELSLESGGITNSSDPAHGRVAWAGRNLSQPFHTSVGFTCTVELPIDYTIHKVTFDREFDTTTSLYNVTVKSEVVFYNSDGQPIATKRAEEGTLSTSSFGSPLDIFRWKTLTVPLPGQSLDLTDTVRYVAIKTRIWFEDYDTGGFAYAFLDNINIQGEEIEQESYRKLRSVDAPAGNWSDYSPSGGKLPLHHYALAVDSASAANLSLIGTDERGYAYLLNSLDGGSTWTQIGRSKWQGVKRAGSYLLLFGHNNISISANIGKTYYSRIGNWAKAVGPVGVIEGVMGTL